MSFLEGFGKSLGAYFTNRAVEEERSERDKKDWEWKAQKTKELEEQFARSRIANVEVFQQGDQYMAQPVNAAGEPIGKPRVASPNEVERRKMTMEDRELAVKGKRASIGRDEAATRASNSNAELAPKELALREKEIGARVRASDASAAESRARAEGQGLINEFYKQGKAPPGKGGDGNTGLESRDIETIRKTVTELGLEPDDPMVSEILSRSSSVQQAEVALRMYAKENSNAGQSGQLTSSDIGSLNFRLTPNQ